VRFACYAPLVVPKGSRFPLAVWAFLQQQHEEMAKRAGKKGDVNRGESTEDFKVRRGRGSARHPQDTHTRLFASLTA
jgi:hypothetical protein